MDATLFLNSPVDARLGRLWFGPAERKLLRTFPRVFASGLLLSFVRESQGVACLDHTSFPGKGSKSPA